MCVSEPSAPPHIDSQRSSPMIDDTLSRRDFPNAACAAGAAAMLGDQLRAQQPPRLHPTADAMILLWMAGGMSHCETWDPKRLTPFETNMEARAVHSTFASIPTSVDGLRISEGLPHC